jgi:hypothetical protein
MARSAAASLRRAPPGQRQKKRSRSRRLAGARAWVSRLSTPERRGAMATVSSWLGTIEPTEFLSPLTGERVELPRGWRPREPSAATSSVPSIPPNRGATDCPRVKKCAGESTDLYQLHESPHYLHIGLRKKHRHRPARRSRGPIPACDVRVSLFPPSVAKIAPASGRAATGSASIGSRRDRGNSKRCVVFALRARNGDVWRAIHALHATPSLTALERHAPTVDYPR